ncbi:hypothetical protein RF11_03495 [Thelohanellus kitauei]|uniref:Uncharacterized protein n=1 Tax=Thelohanellus kitauei TaxID=669202 RepID=A0A0C2J8G5_THEKT|nr:hypothetical protein RF11_03495 [Thelohanellus kitauei]
MQLFLDVIEELTASKDGTIHFHVSVLATICQFSNIPTKLQDQSTKKETTKLLKNLRREYVRWHNSLNPTYRYRNLIYISKKDSLMGTKRTHSKYSCVSSRKNVTIILAMNSLNVVYCGAVTSSLNGDVFKEFLKQFVMDHANFHHLGNLIERTIHDIRFLQPYSPFMNPFEETAPLGTNDLIGRIRDACGRVTSERLKIALRVEGWISHKWDELRFKKLVERFKIRFRQSRDPAEKTMKLLHIRMEQKVTHQEFASKLYQLWGCLLMIWWTPTYNNICNETIPLTSGTRKDCRYMERKVADLGQQIRRTLLEPKNVSITDKRVILEESAEFVMLNTTTELRPQ